jgi:PST family polysaccharide transporter
LEATVSEGGKKSYGEILKSSALIGGSAAMVMGFQMVRNKVMAEVLGTAGVGLIGIYMNIADLARTVAGLGINGSGVRQIAEAVASGDSHRVAKTVTTLRRVALYSGTIGALLLVALCTPVSLFSFGNGGHAVAIALLAFVAFCGDISAAQLALVQGMRKVADIAQINVIGAFFGTVFGIGIVWYWREQGLVPSLMCVAGIAVLTSWWYARRIQVEKVRTTMRDVFGEVSELVKLGLVFMISTLAMQGAMLVARRIVTRAFGLDSAGLYQAASTIGGVYIGIIIQAMATDFYPRLIAAANKPDQMNRLVNEQAEVGLLIAGPGIMATMALAPFVLRHLCSRPFIDAADLLRWFCLGMLLRVIAWPMGYIVLAKGNKKIFFWSEILSWSGYVGFVWLGVKFFGLEGSGMAFFAEYATYPFALYWIVRRLTGFRWTSANRKLWCLFGPPIAAVFGLSRFKLFGPTGSVIVEAALTLLAGLYSLKVLWTLIGTDRLPRQARKIFKLLKLIPSDTKRNEEHENCSNRTGLCGAAPVVPVRPERSDRSGPGY